MILENTKIYSYVHACIFQREKNGPWEWGFDVNGNTICDNSGSVVDAIWDLKDLPSYGAMCLPVVTEK